MKFIILAMTLLIAACSVNKPNVHGSLYQALGATSGIEKLTDAFIEQIQYDPLVMPYFFETDVARFKEKFMQQICEISGGPCNYTGDSMQDIHGGMMINENHFNALVNDLILAMEAIDLPTSTQNRLLALLAPMREDIIYR